ncbi:hypothetical protein HDU85_001124 [Gaertneriomyces sp. JEL0708]|nr:hypothetical protein HDU85_001124 [Gaertneriomyces sp. JEL0708]
MLSDIFTGEPPQEQQEQNGDAANQDRWHHKEPRKNQYFEPGIRGRKTGITAPANIRQDEDGLLNVDDFFRDEPSMVSTPQGETRYSNASDTLPLSAIENSSESGHLDDEMLLKDALDPSVLQLSPIARLGAHEEPDQPTPSRPHTDFQPHHPNQRLHASTLSTPLTAPRSSTSSTLHRNKLVHHTLSHASIVDEDIPSPRAIRSPAPRLRLEAPPEAIETHTLSSDTSKSNLDKLHMTETPAKKVVMIDISSVLKTSRKRKTPGPSTTSTAAAHDTHTLVKQNSLPTHSTASVQEAHSDQPPDPFSTKREQRLLDTQVADTTYDPAVRPASSDSPSRFESFQNDRSETSSKLHPKPSDSLLQSPKPKSRLLPATVKSTVRRRDFASLNDEVPDTPVPVRPPRLNSKPAVAEKVSMPSREADRHDDDYQLPQHDNDGYEETHRFIDDAAYDADEGLYKKTALESPQPARTDEALVRAHNSGHKQLEVRAPARIEKQTRALSAATMHVDMEVGVDGQEETDISIGSAENVPPPPAVSNRKAPSRTRKATSSASPNRVQTLHTKSHTRIGQRTTAAEEEDYSEANVDRETARVSDEEEAGGHIRNPKRARSGRPSTVHLANGFKKRRFEDESDDEASDHEVGKLIPHSDASESETEAERAPIRKGKKGRGVAKPKTKTNSGQNGTQQRRGRKPARSRSEIPEEVAAAVLEAAKVEEEEEEEDPGIRRSRRMKIPPLKYWAGERVVVGRQQSGFFPIPVVKDVIRVSSSSPPPVKRIKKESTPQLIPEVPVINYSTGEEEDQKVVATPDMLNPKTIGAGNYKFEKVFSEGEFIASGILVMPKGSEKPNKNSNTSAMIFYICAGEVEVQIHKTVFVVKTGSQFFVPRGNQYRIKNRANREAKLFFCHGKETVAVDADY